MAPKKRAAKKAPKPYGVARFEREADGKLRLHELEAGHVRAKRGTEQFRRGADGKYSVRLTLLVDGVKIRKMVALGTDNLLAARRKRDAILAAGRFDAPEPEQAETLNSYKPSWIADRRATKVKSVDDEEHWLDAFWLPVLGKSRLDQLRPGDVKAILGDMAKGAITKKNGKPLSRGSISNARATLVRLLGSAQADGLCEKNAAAEVPMPSHCVSDEDQKERTILEDTEIIALLACPAADPEVKMALLLSRVVGGMRSGDLLALTWRSFGEGFATCAVPRAKTRRGGKGRPAQRLDVQVEAVQFIEAWHALNGSPGPDAPVFPVRTGERKGQRKAEGNSWAKALRRDLLRAGIARHELHNDTDTSKRTDFHSVRRGFCTALARENTATSVAMILSGHSSPEVHQRYVSSTHVHELPIGAQLALPPAADVGPPGAPHAEDDGVDELDALLGNGVAYLDDDGELSAAPPGGIGPPTNGLGNRCSIH